MPDAPEIPEATNPFDKRVALTIAIIAVFLSFVENHGDNAKTNAIIQTSLESNAWAHYQAKSIKGEIMESQASVLTRMSGTEEEVGRLRDEIKRYDAEKKELMGEAKARKSEADLSAKIDDRCDQSALMLQISVVLCSIAILSHWSMIWIVGSLLGAAGAIVGGIAFLM